MFLFKRLNIYLIFVVNIILIAGFEITAAQMKSETPYDLSETARRDPRYGGVEGKGGEGFRLPPSRNLGAIPVPPPPVPPRPVPVPAPAPAPPPAPVATPLPPAIVRGSGSNIGSVTLLFNPLSARVKQGAIFPQDIIINNPRGTGFDTAEIMVKYYPEFLAVLSFDSGAPAKTIESKINLVKYPSAKIVVNKVDEANGLIQFKIINETGNFYYSGAIATIHWVAKKKTFGTRVTYAFVGEKAQIGTAIAVQNRDVLGASGDPTDGVVSAVISID